MNKIFDFMRLGIPSLLKTGTIDTIRVSKRLHSLDFSPTFIPALLHVSFHSTLHFDCMPWITCPPADIDCFSSLRWFRDLLWIAFYLSIYPCTFYGSITY